MKIICIATYEKINKTNQLFFKKKIYSIVVLSITISLIIHLGNHTERELSFRPGGTYGDGMKFIFPANIDQKSNKMPL